VSEKTNNKKIFFVPHLIMEEKKGEAAEVPGALSGMWRFDPSHWDGTKWVSSKVRC